MIPLREHVTSSSVKLSVPSQFASLTVVVVVVLVGFVVVSVGVAVVST